MASSSEQASGTVAGKGHSRRAGFVRTVARWLVGGAAAALAIAHAETTVTVWGAQLGPDTIKGQYAVVDQFQKKNPGVRIRLLTMGAGHMNPQKLMTAIVGNVPPDLVVQARFNISDWATRGAFRPLDDLIARDRRTDPLCPTSEQYYPAAWDEAVYKGQVYGIPTGADDRALYWNKRIFRENRSALEAAGLDWRRPPKTWSELLRYSKVLTIPGKRLGFIPNFGNSWLYIYAFENNANFLSPDGMTCTMATPEATEALEFMRKGYDVVGGYQAALRFQGSFQGNESDPFIIGKVAMKIDGDWNLPGLARYGPQTEFGVAEPPVPDDRFYRRGRFAHEKDRFVTWIGGFSYTIPRGAQHVEEAWKFIKYATSVEGRLVENRAQAAWDRDRGRMYIPRIQGNIAANRALTREFTPGDPKFAEGMRMHMSLMDHARTRPPTVVGQLLWDEHYKATEQVLLGKATPLAALRNGQEVVQREIDIWRSRDRHPVIRGTTLAAITGAIAIGLVALVAFALGRRRLTRLAKHEAIWAYLFIAPWIVGFVVLTLGPMLASAFFSFTDYDVLSPPRWVGIRNFADMATLDRENVLKAFSNGAYLAGVGVPLGIVTGLAVALLLNTAQKGMRFYRSFFYMPSIVPTVASAVLWNWLLSSDPNRGLVNSFWQASLTKWLGIAPPGWMSVEAWAKPGLILMGLWGAGSGMVLWLAGLKGVPGTLYEAAGIDGATPSRQFFSVTLPHLSPIIFFNLVMGFIGALQEFDRVYVITSGEGNGPNDALLVPARYLFTNGFGYFKMGYASALAWLVFLVVVLLSLVQFKLAPRWVFYEKE